MTLYSVAFSYPCQYLEMFYLICQKPLTRVDIEILHSKSRDDLKIVFKTFFFIWMRKYNNLTLPDYLFIS